MKLKSLKQKLFKFVAPIFLSGGALDAIANPSGLTVSSGSATAQQIGSQLNVSVSQLAVLNWSSFNIAAGETTTFLQPSSSSIVFNFIGGASPSQIFGNLNANGTVILANANGFYFGPNSMVKVGGSFLATTAPLTPDFGMAGPWQFSGMPPLASIVNYGQIQVGQGRTLFLIAENIENYGGLTAPQGNIALVAGQNVLVSESPDGRGLSAQVQLPQGSVDNFGNITADAGTIALQAKVVNEDGIIQADSIQNQNGTIELVASDQLNLGANSQISANGDSSSGGSSGGKITLQSGNSFSDSAGSQISATGGSQGGNGGSIEVSAPNILSLNSSLNANAQSGWNAGTLLLDPASIILGTSTAGGAIDVNTAFTGFSSILLQASGDITLNPALTWNLSSSTGVSAGQLTLEAGGDIVFGNNSKLLDANNWSVTLDAGYNFGNSTIQSGVGNIYLNGGSGLSENGTIELSGGSANLYAGESILVGTGSIFTTGGGGIFADALAGDINAGTSNGSGSNGRQTSDYLFTNSGSRPNAVLGGISTAAGGDVTLIAGDDIISVPLVPSNQWPGASGAYGAGNVTLVAGNQITGNYNLANGTGTMLAGAQVSSSQAAVLQNPTANPTTYASTLNCLEKQVTQNISGNGNIGTANPGGTVTLSLADGSWNAWAANDIYLNEVNNPNGTFNTSLNQFFLFNYAPNAAANFWAGNAINLVGGNLARMNGENQTMPPIYAPILTLNAGAGGVNIDNSIILDPSSQGGLQITTRDGGNLTGAVANNSTTLTGITVSDSGSANWQTFAQGQASTPLYLNNPNPVILDISGSIESFGLTVPTFANIIVGGSTYNFGFLGQNLSPAQTTSINVAGSITYRGDLTSQILSSIIPVAEFNDVIGSDPTLAGALTYDPSTGTLSFIGVMSAATEQSLLNPTDASGNAIFTGAQLAAWQSGVSQLYAASQNASLGDNGLALSGPGNFNITANSIDLGISGGITALAPDSALAAISPDGANINITTVGDLDMTTTAIANESYLGGINLVVGGALNVGGELTAFGDPSAPKGIFTTSGGDVQITTAGNVNIDGSRVAAYDGGNITIESLNGSVNAGTGGEGYVTLNALELNPITGQLISIPATIPGSGILATTVPHSDATIGNILVETPNGNISAGLGGVVQLSFDGSDASEAVVYLLAGYELRGPSGQGLLTADDLSASDNLTLNASGSQGVLKNSAGDTIGQLVNVSPNENIDSSDSGVIAQTIDAFATGKIEGLLVAFNAIIANSKQPAPLILFGPEIKDTDPGQDGGPSPILISDNNPDVNGIDVNPTQSIAQAPTAEVAQQAATATTVASKSSDDEDDEKKKRKQVALAQKVSRVTVTLPPRNNFPNSTNQTSTATF
jgi:filamentous hemagglutinin family protein